MSERTRWTENDVQYLTKALQSERPDQWEAYLQGEIRDKAIQPDVHQWILMTIHKLYPETPPGELIGLVRLLRDISRRQLGLPD